MGALVFTLALALPSRAQTLATVGTAKITVEEFRRRLAELRGKLVAPPTNEEFLEDLIRYRIGLQEAERQNLARDPVIKERFDQVLYNALLENEIGPRIEKIAVSETEMKSFYRENPELHLAHILIAVDRPGDHAGARGRANKVFDEVRRTQRSFGDLAKAHSDDHATKDNGGDLGYQSRASLLPSLYDAAVKLRTGEATGPIESADGFHILKLIDRRAYDLADKRQIRSVLVERARVAVFNAYFDRLKKQKAYRVELNPEAIKSL